MPTPADGYSDAELGSSLISGAFHDFASNRRVHRQDLTDQRAADAEHRTAQAKFTGLPPGTPADDPTVIGAHKSQEAASSALARAKADLQAAKDVRDTAAKRAAALIHRAITHDGLHDSTWDKIGSAVDGALSDTGHFLADVGETALSDLASISKRADPETVRALTRENESATTLSRAGYDVEQNPDVPGPKNPDYRIEGKVFDNYAPTSDKARNIAREMQKKVDKGQTDRIVLNLSDSGVAPGALKAQLNDWPIDGLKEVIAIDGQGNVIHFYP